MLKKRSEGEAVRGGMFGGRCVDAKGGFVRVFVGFGCLRCADVGIFALFVSFGEIE